MPLKIGVQPLEANRASSQSEVVVDPRLNWIKGHWIYYFNQFTQRTWLKKIGSENFVKLKMLLLVPIAFLAS